MSLRGAPTRSRRSCYWEPQVWLLIKDGATDSQHERNLLARATTGSIRSKNDKGNNDIIRHLRVIQGLYAGFCRMDGRQWVIGWTMVAMMRQQKPEQTKMISVR